MVASRHLLRVCSGVAALALVAACGSSSEPNNGSTKSEGPAIGVAKGPVTDTTGPNGEKPTPTSDIVLSPEDESKIRAGNFTVAQAWLGPSAFQSAVTAGADDEFARLGIDVVARTDANFVAATQAAQIKTVMQRKPDAILSLLADADAAANYMKPAVGAGTELVFLSNPPKGYKAGKEYAGIVTDDLAAMGKAAAEMLGEALNGKGEVGFVYYDANFYVTNQRDAAFRTWLGKLYPDIKIVDQKPMADPTKAQQVVSAMLTRNPNIDGLYVPWAAPPAQSALAALRSTNGSKAKLVTMDLDPTVAVALASGNSVAGIVADEPYEIGRTMARVAALAILGKPVPEFSVTGVTKVNRDNLEAAWKETLQADLPDDVRAALKK